MIEPFSPVGLVVLAIFLVGMVMIALEAVIEMDKFKPALFMTSGFIAIGLWYWLSGTDPQRFEPLLEAQRETKAELFSLIAFMAFMWMIVEILHERNVFNALSDWLLSRGLGPRGIFWTTGLLSALLSPFLNNITTAMIFGKTLKELSRHDRYRHVAMNNIILASNSGVWFIGTSTSLMVLLAGKISILGLLALLPAALAGWVMSAGVLHFFYLRPLNGATLIESGGEVRKLKPGAIGLTVASFLAVVGAVVMNMVLHIDVEFALGIGLGMLALYAWSLKHRDIHVPLSDQFQKVQWDTLLFFIGIIIAVSALNVAGWLNYIAQLFDVLPPTIVNALLGVLSGLMDNVPVEAAAIFSGPALDHSQWALNTLMVGIGGSLTVIGSAAGVMVMSLDRSYTFGVHLRFWPAILVNFFGSMAVWYLQFHLLGLGS